MTLKTKLIPLIFAIALIVPIGVVSAQENTGQTKNNPLSESDLFGEPDPITNTGVIEQAYNELGAIIFSDDFEYDEIKSVIEEMPITGFGSTDKELIVSFDATEEEVFQHVEQLELLYPGINIMTISGEAGFTSTPLITQTHNMNNKVIPNGPRGNLITDTITISNNVRIENVAIEVTLNHEDHDELRYYLTPPNGGDDITLVERPQNISDGVYTHVFNSTSHTELSSLNGQLARGDWILKFGDHYSGSDTGTWTSWSVKIKQTPESINPNIPTTTQLPHLSVIPLGQLATSCNSTIADCKPLVGGMEVVNMNTLNQAVASTITLGGVQTNDGKQGFVMAAHVHGFGNTGEIVGYNATLDSDGNVQIEEPVGIVSINPALLSSRTNSDAVFVKYPHSCGLELLNYCFNPSYHATVSPMKIYSGSGTVYTITDSTHHTTGSHKLIGKVTGPIDVTIITGNYRAIIEGVSVHSSILFRGTVILGDSGAPLITQPNLSGESKIVGMLSGKVGNSFGIATHWSNIDTSLGLRSLS